MIPAFLLLAALLPAIAPRGAFAQPRAFTCVGAEQLEDDVFAIPFPRGAAAPGEAARTNLAAAAERARREPDRVLCVLGHAGPQEGGAQTGLQLAARRAGEVAAALAKLGVDRDRIRAEARRAAYARGAAPEERSVIVVLLPPTAGMPRPAEPRPEAPSQGPGQAPARPGPAKPPEAPARRPDTPAPPAETRPDLPVDRPAPVPALPLPPPEPRPEAPAVPPAERPTPSPPAAAPEAPGGATAVPERQGPEVRPAGPAPDAPTAPPAEAPSRP